MLAILLFILVKSKSSPWKARQQIDLNHSEPPKLRRDAWPVLRSSYESLLKLEFSPPALRLPSLDKVAPTVTSERWSRLRVSS